MLLELRLNVDGPSVSPANRTNAGAPGAGFCTWGLLLNACLLLSDPELAEILGFWVLFSYGIRLKVVGLSEHLAGLT